MLNIYNPDMLTKHMINSLIDKGVRFDVVPGLEPEEYSKLEFKEASTDGNGEKSIIGTIF